MNEIKGTEDVAERTCAGCRATSDRDELVRLVHVPEYEPVLVPDISGRLPGHGVWVHARRACLRKAVRGGFARAFRTAIRVDEGELSALLTAQIERRFSGLLLAAVRRRLVALGTDAVREAIATGAARLLLVAKDAAGRREELCARAGEQRVQVVELSDKSQLGRLTGKETLGVLAVLDSQIAREIGATAQALAGLSEDG